MLKRPLPIYFVAFWCFWGLALQVNGYSRLVASYFAEGQNEAIELRTMISGFAILLVIWHVVRLVQLKSFNRWFSIMFFGIWTVTLVLNSCIIALRPDRRLRPVAVLLLFAAFNAASISYLVRRSFRSFAVQFVAERQKEKHSRTMQKISQKKVQKGLRDG
jgi:hypothetical protein